MKISDKRIKELIEFCEWYISNFGSNPCRCICIAYKVYFKKEIPRYLYHHMERNRTKPVLCYDALLKKSSLVISDPFIKVDNLIENLESDWFAPILFNTDFDRYNYILSLHKELITINSSLSQEGS